MKIFFMLVIGALMFAVVAVLFAGLVGVARGGSADPARANQLMRWRVILQGAALLLFIIFMSLLHP